MQIVIFSTHSQEVLLTKIKEGTDKPNFLFQGFFASKPFLCSFRKNRFQLQKKINYRNSFLPIFYGEVLPNGAGSQIRGEFHMNLFVRIFMTVWFSGVIFGAISIIVEAIHREGVNQIKTPMFFIPFAMIIFGILLVKTGQWFTRNHRAEMETFLSACAGEAPVDIKKFQPKPWLSEQFLDWEILVRRGLAFLWDSVIPSIPMLIYQPFNHSFISTSQWMFLPSFFIYESMALFWFQRGLGKAMIRLIVRPSEGEKLELSQIFLRTVVKVVCLAPLYVLPNPEYGIPLSAVLFLAPWFFSDKHRFLHEKISDTHILFQQ